MKKRILSVILAAAMILSLGGCGGAADDTAKTGTAEDTKEEGQNQEELRIGLSLVSMTFPYFVKMYDTYERMCEERGWELTFADGNLDASTQLNGIQDMINSDVDVMVVSTWYLDAMEDVFAQCQEKGIPVFVVGNTEFSDSMEDLVTFACGTEHYDSGYLGGTWCADYLNEQNKKEIDMVIMSGTTEQMKERGQGFVDALKENGINANVLNEYDVSTREVGMSSTEDALTVYPDLDLVYGVSAQGALGAYDATIGANRTNVLIVGYDGEDEEMEMIDKKGNYIATITQNPQGEAEAVIHAVERWQNQEEGEKVELIPAGIYCAQGQLTADQVLGK